MVKLEYFFKIINSFLELILSKTFRSVVLPSWVSFEFTSTIKNNVKTKNKLILETHELFYENLLKKLKIYKLRSKVLISKIENIYSFIIFGDIEKDKN